MELRQLFNKKNIIKPVCIEVRPLCREHWNQAMSLAWYVFNEFDAKDYSERGIESFWEFITDETLHKMFIMGSYHVFGAYDKSTKHPVSWIEPGLATSFLHDILHVTMSFSQIW